jgi:hypothetical protein
MTSRINILKLALIIILIIATGELYGQVRVKEKPVPPKVDMKMPPKPGPEYIMLPGRWAWHRPSHMYIWLGPRWIVPPKGKTYHSGYWKEVDSEWLWVPGKWKRKLRFFQKRNKTLSTD